MIFLILQSFMLLVAVWAIALAIMMRRRSGLTMMQLAIRGLYRAAAWLDALAHGADCGYAIYRAALAGVVIAPVNERGMV